MKSGIYLLRLGNLRYVGKSNNMPRRWATHRAELENGTHHCRDLQTAWNLGERQLRFRVLCYCPAWQLRYLEPLYIQRRSNVLQRRETASLCWLSHLPPINWANAAFYGGLWMAGSVLVQFVQTGR